MALCRQIIFIRMKQVVEYWCLANIFASLPF